MQLSKIENIAYGTDPELFLRRGGEIIGSEKVIPVRGLKPRWAKKPIVVRDGVQVELNPPAAIDLRVLGEFVGAGFDLLKGVADQSGAEISLDPVVEVSRKELRSLSVKSRLLGCLPSKNIYGRMAIEVPRTYPVRSAGGHLHRGVKAVRKDLMKRVDYMVWLHDVFVGNTCVLFDRDPLAAKRRENYGRAGEYRVQPHGFEYRTLSNFWLRNYTLMKMVFDLSDMAIAVAARADAQNDLPQYVDAKAIRAAIDQNDFHLAHKNAMGLHGFVADWLSPFEGAVVFDSLHGMENIAIEKRFTNDPVEHWLSVDGVGGD